MNDLRARYQAEIIRYATELASKPMRYGEDDCLLFVANIDRAVTGNDPAFGVRARYRTKRGAARVMGRGGVATMAERVAARCGWREIKPAKARAGDRGLIDTPNGPSAVIFSGAFWFGRADVGVVALSTAAVTRAWAI